MTDTGVPRHESVAIVGLDLRVSDCDDAHDFWSALRESRQMVSSPPSWRRAELESDNNAISAGFLSGIESFDREYFGILPAEARLMDPQQRLFLETAARALENAGLPARTSDKRSIGVFVGVGYSDYAKLMEKNRVGVDAYWGPSVAPTSIANKVSYLLNLSGPSEIIDTACSSSLVALHRAVNSINNRECDYAIVGGVNVTLDGLMFVAFRNAGMLSPSGRCRTFDANADGYVRGEGVGAVVIMAATRAASERRFMLGAVAGSAVNHGGHAHSYTAPSVQAQVDVIRSAWARSGQAIQDARFVECHGTGTPLGDPIEFEALKRTFGIQRMHPLGLGALKSNIGHLEAAAGIAGLIKVILCMQFNRVAANINFDTPNRHIDVKKTQFYFPLKNDNQPIWSDGSTNVAAISSFGFGGVNAHAVITKPPSTINYSGSVASKQYLLLISAHDDSALRVRISNLLRHFGIIAGQLAHAPTFEEIRDRVLIEFDVPAEFSERPFGEWGVPAWRIKERLDSFLEGADVEVDGTVNLSEISEILFEKSRDIGDTSGVLEDGMLAYRDSKVALPLEVLRKHSLADVEFTLANGREQLPSRIAVIGEGWGDIITALNGVLTFSRVLPFSGKCIGGLVSPNAEGNRLRKLGREWSNRHIAELSWSDIFPESPNLCNYVPLPSYPFKRTRFWYRELAPERVLEGGRDKTRSLAALGCSHRDPDIQAWLQIFSGIMSDHFRNNVGPAALAEIKIAIGVFTEPEGNLVRVVSGTKISVCKRADNAVLVSAREIFLGAPSQLIHVDKLDDDLHGVAMATREEHDFRIVSNEYSASGSTWKDGFEVALEIYSCDDNRDECFALCFLIVESVLADIYACENFRHISRIREMWVARGGPYSEVTIRGSMTQRGADVDIVSAQGERILLLRGVETSSLGSARPPLARGIG